MQTDTKPLIKPRTGLLSLVLALVLAGITSCSINLVPSYDKEITSEVHTLMKDIDVFYLIMQEMPNDERHYDAFVEKYISIEADLHALYLRNKVRPLNEESTENCLIALEKWRKYKARHKERDSLSDANIELQNMYMHDLLYCILTAEEAKKGDTKTSDD
ncbi:MAG: hypothetical protein U9Q98_11405 [Bacteroidota bacterium]|nr:hypothetical protein [Bacteroidota bacterium]